MLLAACMSWLDIWYVSELSWPPSYMQRVMAVSVMPGLLLQVIGRLANGLAMSPSELAHCGELFQTWQQALFVVPANLPGEPAESCPQSLQPELAAA